MKRIHYLLVGFVAALALAFTNTGRVIQTTAFTRLFLRSADAATARSTLGVSSPTFTGQFDYNAGNGTNFIGPVTNLLCYNTTTFTNVNSATRRTIQYDNSSASWICRDQLGDIIESYKADGSAATISYPTVTFTKIFGTSGVFADTGSNFGITTEGSLLQLRSAADVQWTVDDTGNLSQAQANANSGIHANYLEITNGATACPVNGNVFTLTTEVTYTNNATAYGTLVGGSGNGVGTTNLSPNFFVLGRSLIIDAAGIYSAAATATRTNQLIFGTNTISTGTIALFTAGAANHLWTSHIVVTCLSTGTAGTFKITGSVTFLNVSTAVANTVDGEFVSAIGATTTANTTAAIPIDYRTGNSATTGSQTMQTFLMDVKR